MLQAGPGRCTSLVELEKWHRNPNAATAASAGHLSVRSCNRHVLPGEHHPKPTFRAVGGQAGSSSLALILGRAAAPSPRAGCQRRSWCDTHPISSGLLLRERLEK